MNQLLLCHAFILKLVFFITTLQNIFITLEVIYDLIIGFCLFPIDAEEYLKT